MNLVFVYLRVCFSFIAQFVYYSLHYLTKNICLFVCLFIIFVRQGSNFVFLQQCLSYFWPSGLSNKFGNCLVNFHIHKSEVIISLSAGSHCCCWEVNWKFNCCFFEGIKGYVKIFFLYLCGLQINYFVSSVDFLFILINIH